MTALLSERPTPIGRVVHPTIPELLAKLAALGDPQQVAYFLEGEGIEAVPCSSSSCAIAVYLRRETGIGELAVGDANVVVWYSGAVPDMVVPLPYVVQDFVSAFDHLEFPGLLDNSWGLRSTIAVLAVKG